MKHKYIPNFSISTSKQNLILINVLVIFLNVNITYTIDQNNELIYL